MDRLPDAHGLSPDEIQHLRLVAARARLDRGDLAPMRRVLAPADGPPSEEVIPWLDALNLEVH